MFNKHKHRFLKWGEIFNSSAVRDSGHFGDTVEIKVVVQERICIDCNLVEARRVRQGSVNKEGK